MAAHSPYSPIDLAQEMDASSFKIGLVVSDWNPSITLKLREGAKKVLELASFRKENLIELSVPGSFELIAGAQLILENKVVDAVICLGCVIQGETRHFDFICSAVSTGIAQLTIQYKKPVIFGVLTTQNQGQALERSGGAHGNKGEEASLTALKMVQLRHTLIRSRPSPAGFL